MRNLFIILLLSGCSSLEQLSAETKGEKTDAEKIYQAEAFCMKSRNFEEASEYNACVDKALGANQMAKTKVAARAARAKKEHSATGFAETDYICEHYGHVIGTDEYELCIDYINENLPSTGAGKQSKY